MSLLEIIQLLFKKLGDKDVIIKQLQSIWHIPGFLKIIFITSLVLGTIYFGYSKIYTYEIESIKEEINNINVKLIDNLYNTQYQNDMFYMFESLMTAEALIRYIYSEQQLQLQLLQRQFQRNHPDDPILLDITEIINRNNNTYKYYINEFNRSLQKCNPDIYKQLHDTLQIPQYQLH